MIKNIEVLVQKALTSVKLQGVRFQNLTHLICLLARHFPENLNALNIVSRLMKLLTAEIDLGTLAIDTTESVGRRHSMFNCFLFVHMKFVCFAAVQIIQHAFRQHVEKRRAATHGYTAGQLLSGNIRTKELSEQWKKYKTFAVSLNPPLRWLVCTVSRTLPKCHRPVAFQEPEAVLCTRPITPSA